MSDPVTISLVSVGSVVISEGIKFLYGQAGELLKRLREQRKTSAEGKDALPTPAPIEVNVTPPRAIRTESFVASVDSSALARLEPSLRGLRSDLLEYVEGVEPLDDRDHAVLQRIDALRAVLEVLYKRELTFDGEVRVSPTPDVQSRVDAGDVAGYVAGVRAKSLQSGRIQAQVSATVVREGASVVGTDIDQIGAVRVPKE